MVGRVGINGKHEYVVLNLIEFFLIFAFLVRPSFFVSYTQSEGVFMNPAGSFLLFLLFIISIAL